MTYIENAARADTQMLADEIARVIRAIPPAWPLTTSVAVNPFLGQTGHTLAQASALLERVAGVSVTMPRGWYLDRIASGSITGTDLSDALDSAPAALRPADVAELKAQALRSPEGIHPLPAISELAAEASGIDWPAIVADRIGAWASGYFDEGQALWAAPQGKGPYAAWRAVATHDLTPEIAGLTGFAAHVLDAPENASDAIARAALRLGLRPEETETYFHRLLMTLGGSAQFARYKMWQAELGGGSDDAVTDFLAIRIVWEEALYLRYADRIRSKWESAREAYAMPVTPTARHAIDAILQEAWERSAQRALAATLAAPEAKAADGRPAMQAAFCIDVRSEPFRRALEAVNPDIRTLGFAGFFGLGALHRRFASDVPELRLPVLLNPSLVSCSGGAKTTASEQQLRVTARAKRAWGRFKLAAVSSFAFVEAMGPVYAGKLLRDSFGPFAVAAPRDPAPRFDPALDLETRTGVAASVLRAMSLTQNFAPLVLLAGHGAGVVNNPHASALHCGACGGYSGEVNARLLAALLNDPEVRARLVPLGISIPEDTVFLGALHDTTTDDVTIYADGGPAPFHEASIAQAKKWLAAAGKTARDERAKRLPRASGGSTVHKRGRDWAEIRPEWGLAGCSTFIAAPRKRTAGKNLSGQAFLHDYDWKNDEGFGVLELIMTAPVVVASWISLQYYGSVVAPHAFGGGNKVLHNVVGGIGVVEGNGGLLRAGLPWQSVHDGERYIHEPLRLSVCIEAPREAITDVLLRHSAVRALFDNRWMHLFALDGEGRMAWRYAGDLEWTENSAPDTQHPSR